MSLKKITEIKIIDGEVTSRIASEDAIDEKPTGANNNTIQEQRLAQASPMQICLQVGVSCYQTKDQNKASYGVYAT